MLWSGCKDLRVPGLAFSDFHFNGDPGAPLDDEQLNSQVEHLGAFISNPANARALNLYLPEHRTRRLPDLSLPIIESIRCARRVAPDGRVIYDTIAEITQTCTVRTIVSASSSAAAAVVIDPCGVVRYAITKTWTARPVGIGKRKRFGTAQRLLVQRGRCARACRPAVGARASEEAG
jgi:hypothetical protein